MLNSIRSGKGCFRPLPPCRMDDTHDEHESYATILEFVQCYVLFLRILTCSNVRRSRMTLCDSWVYLFRSKCTSMCQSVSGSIQIVTFQARIVAHLNSLFDARCLRNQDILTPCLPTLLIYEMLIIYRAVVSLTSDSALASTSG